jgi:hypothetical protein
MQPCYQAKLRAINPGKRINQHGASIVRDPYTGFSGVPDFSSSPNNNGGNSLQPDGIKYYKLMKISGGSNTADMYR